MQRNGGWLHLDNDKPIEEEACLPPTPVVPCDFLCLPWWQSGGFAFIVNLCNVESWFAFLRLSPHKDIDLLILKECRVQIHAAGAPTLLAIAGRRAYASLKYRCFQPVCAYVFLCCSSRCLFSTKLNQQPLIWSTVVLQIRLVPHRSLSVCGLTGSSCSPTTCITNSGGQNVYHTDNMSPAKCGRWKWPRRAAPESALRGDCAQLLFCLPPGLQGGRHAPKHYLEWQLLLAPHKFCHARH